MLFSQWVLMTPKNISQVWFLAVEKFADGMSEIRKRNEQYSIWKRFTKILLSWLMASISESMFSHLATCRTANEDWLALEHYFVTESKARLVSLRTTLQTLKKGSLSVHEYIRRMKNIFDALVSSGQSIVEEEMVNYIIKGLGPEFEPIVMHTMASIDGSVEKLSLQELKLILQKYESRLSKFPHDFSLSFANLANQHAKSSSGGTNVGSSFMKGGVSGQFLNGDGSNVVISGGTLE